jgi:microcin C transport system substrate-binding protein
VAFTRREALIIGAGAITGASGLGAARAQEQKPGAQRPGISAFGELKYPADFKNFDYVNPAAPKGGFYSEVVTSRGYNGSFLTFNSLNAYIFKGEGAIGMGLTFASLLAHADDEPDAMYGFAASSIAISDDGLTYHYSLRPEAKFHDGSPLTAKDVVFSLTTLKEKGHTIITQRLRDFKGAREDGERAVIVTFAPKRARDVPLFVAGLPIFSSAYYANRPFDESSLEAPLGSGPYKVGRFDAGRYIEFDRVKDWWGADLPIMRGQHNFDIVRFEYYRDREAGFEGFTAKKYLFREEFTAKVWATRYDFPALKDGRVKQAMLPDDTPSGGQGWFMNLRREKFKDIKLREAIIDAFDFEWTNQNIMYGAYKRTFSVFQNSNMTADGKPTAEELELLTPFRGQVAEEVFGEPFMPPVSDGSGQDRALLRKASQLLQQAGYVIKDGKRVNPKGEPITFEFLLDEPTFQPHHMPFIKNLGMLGIDATLRIVDPVQFRKRVDEFDFDITMHRFGFSSTPGDSLRSYFSTQAAKLPGSQNLGGIADPVIDALIEKIIEAKTRTSLIFACRALDRVIRAGRYWIPHWYLAAHRIAYWDVFGFPEKKPGFARGIPETWWYDQEKAAKLERGG